MTNEEFAFSLKCGHGKCYTYLFDELNIGKNIDDFKDIILDVIQNNYVWHLPAPAINKDYEETIETNVNVVSNIVVSPIIVVGKETQEEQLSIGTNIESTITISPVEAQRQISPEENLEVESSFNSDIVVSLVGTTPI